MKLLGFNFTKINAEKNSENTKGVQIKPNIDVSDIKEAKADLLNTPGKVLSVFFNYTLNYGSEYGKVELGGKILVSIEQETADQILEDWKSNSIPNEFKTKVFNLILRKANLKALQIEDELNMPLHMQMPKVKPQEQSKSE